MARSGQGPSAVENFHFACQGCGERQWLGWAEVKALNVRRFKTECPECFNRFEWVRAGEGDRDWLVSDPVLQTPWRAHFRCVTSPVGTPPPPPPPFHPGVRERPQPEGEATHSEIVRQG